ncbi:MAG: Phosphatidylinositol-4-phosphate 5-kinase [Caeruleum heppii]|nr:MAG: Phosphatidylinositol-4-phosphate 5-kinase [Caeruleum heppii]
MPSFISDDFKHQTNSSHMLPHRPSHDKQSVHSNANSSLTGDGHIGHGPEPNAGTKLLNGLQPHDSHTSGSLHSLPNGRPSGTFSISSRDKLASRDGSTTSSGRPTFENGRRSPGPQSGLSRSLPAEVTYFPSTADGRPPSSSTQPMMDGEPMDRSRPRASHDATVTPSTSPPDSGPLKPPSRSGPHRFSSPPTVSNSNTATGAPSASSSSQNLNPPPLKHRHTLQVPRLSTSRTSRDFSAPISTSSGDILSPSGRFSPTASSARRGSLTLGRRTTRSIHSDLHVDEVPQDEDAARWSEAIRYKRASKRRKKEDDDDDRVVIGTKVDQHHVNWVTAYNMLTGIRFTVSRTNAKMDRVLTDADFNAKHKFSFDITGNELTPSAKYDFKFKDYAPWVFRHLRNTFKLDPADYLVSLTSKYILSELGTPGKSGSFFYFSRDYKYIIKTIHHAEHKFLRKILWDYFNHVEENPNTLLSQFYGLHRVKIPYGRKIHFVVMNNLFPPHRDIHQTFDLKGSTIGRELKEEQLEKNPRATLKDLNWLRRSKHLQFGPTKKRIFIEQMERDVALLQRLKIMDYSMLVGIHDLEKGNEENLRDKTLRIFQPGGEKSDDSSTSGLIRTPSKLENARKARELREIIKREKPIPMEQTSSRMPDELLAERKHFTFYGDDGGFRATHEDDRPGEEIYYLGIIDCLTYYSIVKKVEHVWKGLSDSKSQISSVPPQTYGQRFIRFIIGTTKSPEEVERERLSGPAHEPSLETYRVSGHLSRSSTDKVMEKAERQARRTEKDGASEGTAPERTLSSAKSGSPERPNGGGTILPVVDEVGEAGSREQSVSNEKEGDTRNAVQCAEVHVSNGKMTLEPPQVRKKSSTQREPLKEGSRGQVSRADNPETLLQPQIGTLTSA